ncbi:lysozyme inhibitor LprI family protein [Microbulbifer agarilyticus]|nr:lysozyme inhibitor LprI family protein [Microbulbifer agarilyticus]
MINALETLHKNTRKMRFWMWLTPAMFSSMALASEPNIGPSFDCRKSSNIIEEAICNDEHLSFLDRQMNTLYKKNMEFEDRRESVSAAQKEWLRSERAMCVRRTTKSRIRACLASSYRERSKELFMLGRLPPGVVEYTLSKGRMYELCGQYVELMNRVDFNPNASCGLSYPFDETANANGLSEIQWEVMRKEESIEVLRFYWERIGKRSPDSLITEESQREYREFIENVEQLSRSELDLNFDGVKESVYRFPKGGACKSNQFVHFIFDRSIPADHFERSKIYGELFRYKGRMYSFYGSPATNFLGVNEIYGDEYFLNERYLCDFKVNIRG